MQTLILLSFITITLALPQGYNYDKQTSAILPQTSYSQQSLKQNLQQQAPIITKDYYVHAAPEEQVDNEDFSRNLANGPIRKHYRIIFIKAPSQTKAAADALRLAQAQNEEKTVIYVLSKKTDLTELQNQLTEQKAQSQNYKPEVFFIKYKTQDEARHAQQQIQAQYDALGGTSQTNDEGIAPISSVIGALDNKPSAFILPTASLPSSSLLSNPSNSYLPSNRF